MLLTHGKPECVVWRGSRSAFDAGDGARRAEDAARGGRGGAGDAGDVGDHCTGHCCSSAAYELEEATCGTAAESS